MTTTKAAPPPLSRSLASIARSLSSLAVMVAVVLLAGWLIFHPFTALLAVYNAMTSCFACDSP